MQDSYADWRDRLATANDPRFWPIEAIESMLIAGTAQFWSDGKAALVTRINEYPGGAVVLEAVAAAGDMGSLHDEIDDQTEAWAREQGIPIMLSPGRIGWPRVLADKGWKHYQTVLIKELAHGL